MIRRSACLAMALLSACALRAAEPVPEASWGGAAAAEEVRFRRTMDLAEQKAREQKLDEARALYAEARALRGDDPRVVEALLAVLRRQGDWAAQLPLVEWLCLRHPGNSGPAFDRGECLWRLGRAAEAKQAFDGMLRRFAHVADLHDRVVQFYLAEKRPADARAALDERRRRFGDDSGTRFADAQIALLERKAAAAVDALMTLLGDDLDDSSRDRAEALLMDAAAQSGRMDDVAKRLAASLDALDARIAARLIELARRAADNKDFAVAASLAERALDSIKDPAGKAGLAAQIALWKAAPPR